MKKILVILTVIGSIALTYSQLTTSPGGGSGGGGGSAVTATTAGNFRADVGASLTNTIIVEGCPTNRWNRTYTNWIPRIWKDTMSDTQFVVLNDPAWASPPNDTWTLSSVTNDGDQTATTYIFEGGNTIFRIGSMAWTTDLTSWVPGMRHYYTVESNITVYTGPITDRKTIYQHGFDGRDGADGLTKDTAVRTLQEALFRAATNHRATVIIGGAINANVGNSGNEQWAFNGSSAATIVGMPGNILKSSLNIANTTNLTLRGLNFVWPGTNWANASFTDVPLTGGSGSVPGFVSGDLIIEDCSWNAYQDAFYQITFDNTARVFIRNSSFASIWDTFLSVPRHFECSDSAFFSTNNILNTNVLVLNVFSVGNTQTNIFRNCKFLISGTSTATTNFIFSSGTGANANGRLVIQNCQLSWRRASNSVPIDPRITNLVYDFIDERGARYVGTNHPGAFVPNFPYPP